MKYIIVVVLSTILVTLYPKAMTDQTEAYNTLLRHGLHNGVLLGHSWFKCELDEYFSVKFKGYLYDNIEVTGTVCKGFFTIPRVIYDK